MQKLENLRLTRQRRVILEEIRKLHNHPGADEIYTHVRKVLPRISLGTVYRNLEILSRLGEINKLEYGGNQKRFDGDPQNHYHIRCTCCDRVDDAPLPLITDIENRIKKSTDFKIIGHRLEFIGLCADCAANPLAPGLKGAAVPSQEASTADEG